MKLTYIQTVAAAKAIKSKVASEASKHITPGTKTVEIVLRIFGSITKGEDYEQPITGKLPKDWMLAYLLDRVNAATVDAMLREIPTPEDRSEATETLMDGLKPSTAAVLDGLRETTVRDCTGKVTTSLAVERIE